MAWKLSRGSLGGLLLIALSGLSACETASPEPDDDGSAGEAGNSGDDGGSGGHPGASGGSTSLADGGTDALGGASPHTGGSGSEAENLRITPADLAPGRVGAPYEVELSAEGARGSLTWHIVGSLPPGLAFDSDEDLAVLAGTPTSAGIYSVSVSVEDAEDEVVVTYPLRVLALPWLLYNTDDTISAVALSGTSVGEPQILSRALEAEETLWIGEEQPGRPQVMLGYSQTLKQEAWVVSLAGLEPQGGARVNSPQGTKTWAQGFRWSPDGSRMSWEAETEEHSSEGFVADMSGPAPGAPSKVSGQLPEDGYASGWGWLGLGALFSEFDPVRYADDGAGSRYLFIDTTTLPPPAPIPLTDWTAELISSSPAGDRVAYWEREDDTHGVWWVRALDGETLGAPDLLHPSLSAAQTAGSWVFWTPDGRSAFTYTQEVSGWNTTLYRTVFSDDGTPVPQPYSTGAAYARQPYLSPDATRLYFMESSGPLAEDGELWLVDVSGAEPSEAVKLNAPLVAGGGLAEDGSIVARWSPDSHYVAYLADALQVGMREAFVVDVTDPGVAKRVNTSLPSATSSVTALEFSPDGAWIAILADLDTAGIREVYVVPFGPAGPGVPQKASGPLTAGETISNGLTWSPDGQYLAFTMSDDVAETVRLQLVRLHDGTKSAPIPIGVGNDRASSPTFLEAGF